MSIIHRNGPRNKFDKSKMKTAEWAFPDDGTCWYCVKPGDCRQVATATELQHILTSSTLNLVKIKNIKYIGFSPNIADYICDGFRDDEQFAQAVNDMLLTGGRIIVLQGNYHFSKKVDLCSNLTIEFEKGAKIIMDPQVSALITTDIEVGNTTTTVSEADIEKFQIGMEIGFITDGSTGYKYGEDASIIIDISENVITFSAAASKEYTSGISTIVSLNSCLAGLDTPESILSDIEIIGGELDGNKANTHTWVRDLHQNGLIFGGVHNLKLRGVVVHDFNFQNIHVSGTVSEGDNIGTVLDGCIAYGSWSSGICLDTIPDATTVTNCIGYSNGNSGIQLVDTDKCTIFGGSYKDNGFCGVRSAHDDIVVHGNKFIGVSVTGNGRGFGIRNNNGTIISGCFTSVNNEAGVYLEEDCVNVQVTNCTFEDEALGVKELAIGTNNNSIICPIFKSCVSNYNISSASIIEIDGADFKVNRTAILKRAKFDAANNHFQLSEGGVTRWHIESVNRVFSLVESGVLERLIISGNEANLQADLKMRKFGCNGKDAQDSTALNSALSEDLAEVTAADLNATNALLNQLRLALINCGIGS